MLYPAYYLTVGTVRVATITKFLRREIHLS